MPISKERAKTVPAVAAMTAALVELDPSAPAAPARVAEIVAVPAQIVLPDQEVIAAAGPAPAEIVAAGRSAAMTFARTTARLAKRHARQLHN